MVEELHIFDFTSEEYWKYVAIALPIIRDGDVRPFGKFESLVGLPQLSAPRFLNRLSSDGLIIGGHIGSRRVELTPLGYRLVQHIVTVRAKEGRALMHLKIKIPEWLK